MQLYILNLSTYEGPPIHPCLLKTKEALVLVDCGYPGQLLELESEIENVGLDPAMLTYVVITHHDFDHMGGLSELISKYPKIKVCSSLIEKDYIDGSKISLRLLQAQAISDSLTGQAAEKAKKFESFLQTIVPVNVDLIFCDGDYLLPGIKIISTSGHTPGHISIFLDDKKILIAADAVVFDNDEFHLANPEYTLDKSMARESVAVLMQHHPEAVVCYHGGEVTENVFSRLKTLYHRLKE
jgi:glyoxylase-like metal-dependent hydrolase (beta-lactamase superfamily II)